MDTLQSTARAPRASALATDDAIVELLPVAVCVCDADGLIVRYNRKASEYWGRSPRDGGNERFCGSHRLFRPDGQSLPRHRTPMAEVLRNGSPVRGLEVLIEQPDGARVRALVDADPIRNQAGEVTGAISCFRDVTGRENTHEQERESREVPPAAVGTAPACFKVIAGEGEHEASRASDLHLAQVLEALPAAVYTTDAAGRITSYNQAAADLWGCRPDTGKDLWCGSWRLYRPDGTPLPHDQCPMAVALKENRSVRSVEAVLERPDGTRVPFSPYPTPLRDASGALVGAVNMLVDISHLKQAEEQKQAAQVLRRAKEAAERANAAKSRFLAAASHDLRQPLQALDLQRAVLARRVADPEVLQTVQELGLSVEVMRNTLDALLDLSQLETGAIKAEIVEFGLDELFRRIVSEFHGLAAAKGLRLKVVFSKAIVRSDPRLLERVLQNLVANAVKYTHAGKVLLGCRRRGGRLRVEVGDTGIGIAPDQLEAIFEEFYQVGNAARERRFGLGLGLSIAHAAAELLDSPLDVRSTLGQGSMFAVAVPFVRRVAAEPVTRGKHAHAGAAALSAAVLLVEDDAAIRGALRTLLELDGYRVAAAASGREALALVEQGACRPTMAIVDQNLPGDLSGVETVQRLRGLTSPHLPALVITGDVLPERLASIRAAALPYLTKPVKAEELGTLVRGLLDNPSSATAAPTASASLRDSHAARLPASTERVVHIVEDDPVQARSLQRLLAAAGRQAEIHASAEAFLADYHPGMDGCLVVDVHLPGKNGLELQRELARRGGPPCVFVTGHGELVQVVQAMREGAVDFLVKPVSGEALLVSVERALNQARHRSLAELASAEKAARLDQLTAREREVAELVADGLPNKEVAYRLGVSQRTVEGHRARAMDKLGVRTLPELVRLSLSAGRSQQPGTA